MRISDVPLSLERKAAAAALHVARDAFLEVKKQIESFYNTVGPDFDVAMRLAGLGAFLPSHVEYVDPTWLVFKGDLDGSPARIVMHVSQLSFVLIGVQKGAEQPRRKIGFQQVKADHAAGER
jgi:hypothetical protein